MHLSLEKEISKTIFEMSEENMYKMLENLKENNSVDQSLVYCFIKAFYIHTAKLYLKSQKAKVDFEEIYVMYQECMKNYYKINNPDLEEDLLNHILEFFVHSFALLETLGFTQIQDSYEFRHYVIKALELLRIILENKSKSPIRETIFENYTKIIVEQCDNLFVYFDQKTQKS